MRLETDCGRTSCQRDQRSLVDCGLGATGGFPGTLLDRCITVIQIFVKASGKRLEGAGRKGEASMTSPHARTAARRSGIVAPGIMDGARYIESLRDGRE